MHLLADMLFKNKKAAKLASRVKEAIDKEFRDRKRGFTYMSGVAAPQVVDSTTDAANDEKTNQELKLKKVNSGSFAMVDTTEETSDEKKNPVTCSFRVKNGDALCK